MRCLSCGVDVPAGFRFCGSCGAPLTAFAGPSPEERRVVSALFCDLAGFTQWSEPHDPEDVRGMLRAYYEAVQRELVRFGGTVDKFIGDAIFGLFGAPRAHEDDPERAVRAALAALDAVADLRAAWADAALHVRIGITTGEALVHLAPAGDSQGMAWGDVVNTASRLETAAPVDGILVDEATHRATRHVIAYGGAEPIRAKGKTSTVPVWQALAPLAHRGLDGALARADRRPLVDREPELDCLVTALATARADRSPQLVTLVGDPGIGKTSVLLELARRLDARPELIFWRHGRSPPYPEGVAFWALGEIVKAQAGMLETDDAATAASKLGRAVRELVADTVQAARIEGQLRSLVGLGRPEHAGRDEHGAAFAAWRHFLEALARQRPLILVFEDLHWADDGLLDFVEHLIEWSEDVPMLVICTARPELFDRRPGWGSADAATTIAIGPLSNPDTRELIEIHAGAATLPAASIDAIVSSAAGNPLFSVEFVRMLADRGLLGGPDEPGAAGAVADLPVPDSLRGIIASRLDSLTPEEKAVLQAAAVIGRAAWPGALAAIVGRPRRWCVEQLATLERKEFVGPARRSSVEHEPEHRFHHVLIRDVAYSQILRSRRGDMHRRTAEWLESLSPDRTADRAEMLAHHYRCAYELARAVGAETADLADRARHALANAGDRALGLHAFPVAARFFRAALDLWPPDDPERPSLLLRLGKSVYYAETAGGELLAEARDALLAAGDSGSAAAAECFLASLAHHEGRHDRVSEHFERAVALVSALGPTEAKADVLVEYANHREVAGERAGAIGAASEALEIARTLRLRELEARALSIMGMADALSGDPGGRDELRRSIAIAEEIGSHLSADGCGRLADLESQLGDLEACFALQARARVHAERFSHGPFVRWLAAERVGEGYWRGDWDEALSRADAVIAEVETGTPNFMEGYCRAMRGRMRLARDDVAGALDDAGRSLEFARAAEDPQMLYPALAFAAHAEVVAGSREVGAAYADDLLAQWTARLDAYPASGWAVDLAYALEALGRGADLLEPAAAARTRTRWLDALVPFASGDFGAAAAQFAAIGSRPDEARARLRAAAALFAAGRTTEGGAELEAALRFHRGVRAARCVREAEALTG